MEKLPQIDPSSSAILNVDRVEGNYTVAIVIVEGGECHAEAFLKITPGSGVDSGIGIEPLTEISFSCEPSVAGSGHDEGELLTFGFRRPLEDAWIELLS